MSRHWGAARARRSQEHDVAQATSLRVGSAPSNVADQLRCARLDELYRRHADWLRKSLQRRYGAQWADDLTQETFFRAAAYANGDIDMPRALLITIAKNVARDQFRRGQVRADHAALFEGVDLAHPGTFGTIDDDYHVREVIKSLPPKFREVILLSKIGGLTNREIAQRCKVSVRAIDKRLQKAMALVVARLRD
ncbi:RNA polymerase sigma factor [Phenylobacterium koreense]|uniref:RNA polymerase sigma-70 factor (ECF subfamily) n=1 Tax=Phenylobacterium koreense TaxID=266125 RepID=A0ABV2EP72_9CAUL